MAEHTFSIAQPFLAVLGDCNCRHEAKSPPDRGVM